ncbi:E4, partial [Micromys minutus papillomavirus 1]
PLKTRLLHLALIAPKTPAAPLQRRNDIDPANTRRRLFDTPDSTKGGHQGLRRPRRPDTPSPEGENKENQPPEEEEDDDTDGNPPNRLGSALKKLEDDLRSLKDLVSDATGVLSLMLGTRP